MDFSTIILLLFAMMAVQPLLIGRWYSFQRAQAIRNIERKHGTRVITMIHRQEKRNLFGFALSRHIDLEDAQTIIAAIKETPRDVPIDLIIHTPGGLVLAAMQIARAVLAGFEIGTDVKEVRHPDRYMDGRGRVMWGKVCRLIEAAESGQERATA